MSAGSGQTAVTDAGGTKLRPPWVSFCPVAKPSQKVRLIRRRNAGSAASALPRRGALTTVETAVTRADDQLLGGAELFNPGGRIRSP